MSILEKEIIIKVGALAGRRRAIIVSSRIRQPSSFVRIPFCIPAFFSLLLAFFYLYSSSELSQTFGWQWGGLKPPRETLLRSSQQGVI